MFDNQKEVTMNDRDEFGAFLVGFIVGGLSGAVVALLFAPQTGEETRALNQRNDRCVKRLSTKQGFDWLGRQTLFLSTCFAYPQDCSACPQECSACPRDCFACP